MTAADAAILRWRNSPDGRVDLFEEMKRVAFDVILDAMLSGAEHFDRDAFKRDISLFFADVNRMRLSYFLRADAYHARRPQRTSAHKAGLMAAIAALVEARRTAPPRGDLVDLLLAARDPETGEGFSDAQLCDNLLGFIMAGHETTAVALTWALYLVARHEPTRTRLRAEVNAVTGGADVGPDHIPNLVFTRQVVSEAMRLYPPAFLLTRISARDTELCGHPVKAGQRVNIPVYALHRRADTWHDPHAFDPDRFAPSAPAPDRFRYLPFGAGPRICIGAAFAMAEIVTVLATIVRAVEIDPPADETVWPQTGLALHPRHGMPVRVTPR